MSSCYKNKLQSAIEDKKEASPVIDRLDCWLASQTFSICIYWFLFLYFLVQILYSEAKSQFKSRENNVFWWTHHQDIKHSIQILDPITSCSSYESDNMCLNYFCFPRLHICITAYRYYEQWVISICIKNVFNLMCIYHGTVNVYLVVHVYSPVFSCCLSTNSCITGH